MAPYAQEEVIDGGPGREVGIVVFDGTEEDSQQHEAENVEDDQENDVPTSRDDDDNYGRRSSRRSIDKNHNNSPTLVSSNRRKELKGLTSPNRSPIEGKSKSDVSNSPRKSYHKTSKIEVQASKTKKEDITTKHTLDNIFETFETPVFQSFDDELADDEKATNLCDCNGSFIEGNDATNQKNRHEDDRKIPDLPDVVRNSTPEFRIFPTDPLSNSIPPRTPAMGEPEMPMPMPLRANSRNSIKKGAAKSISTDGSGESEAATSPKQTGSPSKDGEDLEQQATITATSTEVDKSYVTSLFQYYTCRNKDDKAKPSRMASPRSKDFRIPGGDDDDDDDDEDEDDDIIVHTDSGDSNASSLKLHSLVANHGDVGVSEQPDALDRFFTGVEGAICRANKDQTISGRTSHTALACHDDGDKPSPSTPTISENDIDPESLQTSSPSPGAGFTTPMTSSQLHFFRENSLLDVTRSSEEPVICALDENTSSLSSRLESLRQKKRDIEAQVVCNCEEPGILIPRGYLQKDRIPSSSLDSSQEELEKRKRCQKWTILGVSMVMVITALALLALSFFWPKVNSGW